MRIPLPQSNDSPTFRCVDEKFESMQCSNATTSSAAYLLVRIIRSTLQLVALTETWHLDNWFTVKIDTLCLLIAALDFNIGP